MSALLHTSGRIVRQLRHDRRSVALLLVVPTLLLVLLRYMLEAQPSAFQRVALVMLGFFPFFVMFLLTSIAMLRERTGGTLERLFTTPARRSDLLFGYGLAFGLAAAVQTTLTATVAYALLGLETAGSPWLVLVVAVASALLGVALGLLCSAFARTEFQALQFIPVVILPQVLLCGMFVPRHQMSRWLEVASGAMPLTYSVEALVEVGINQHPTGVLWRDLAILLAVIIVALVLGAVTLRRRTP